MIYGKLSRLHCDILKNEFDKVIVELNRWNRFRISSVANENEFLNQSSAPKDESIFFLTCIYFIFYINKRNIKNTIFQ